MGEIKTVCGLWIKPTKKDPNKKYLSGLDIKALQSLDADRWRIMIFKNDKKRNEKDPDYNVVALENDPNFRMRSGSAPPQAPPSKPFDDIDF